MTRLEFIRGAVASAAVAAVPAAVAAPPFEDIDPDARYDELWHWFRFSGGRWVPVDDAEPRGTPSKGSTLSEYLVMMRLELDPDKHNPLRAEFCRPIGLRRVGSTDWMHLDDAWLREFYRRHG